MYGNMGLLLLLMLIIMGFTARNSRATATNFERASLGSGGVEADGSSYFLSLSEDASVVTFGSFVSNWAPDQIDINYVDIFVRDRIANTTTKISVGSGGGVADQRSFDPFISADGRYISFTSYATNLVAGDTNRHAPIDDGLDVFLYDRVSGLLQRVSLTSKGTQIDKNSVGHVSPDNRYVIFTSNGNGIIQGDVTNPKYRSAIYKRDLQTGEIERITKTADGGFPNGGVGGAEESYDGRYIVYISDTSDIVWDTNGERDVMLYDSFTDQTTLISKPIGGGQSNGLSNPARITPDGRYIAFRSFATNLVPGDTNGQSDIFVYDTLMDTMEIVSVSSSGVLGNGESKDPAICGNGRFVAFTSEATNLVPLPHNGERQVYIHDRVTHTTFLGSGTDTFMGNGRAHRSTLSSDCSTIGFATDANNIVSGDTNGMRDLFVGDIIVSANMDSSTITASGITNPGNVITYTFTLKNLGTETAVATFDSPLPTNTTFVSGSISGAGASYNGGQNAVQWSDSIPGEGEKIISYAVTINPALTEFTLIINHTDVTVAENSVPLEYIFAVNGLKTYLPILHR
ncbi:MAG: DUF11 domain-containing protein [Chloroflexi bacterium]|nr:DUF11 domain-containing protein [Chloroflexota bacterium]